MTTDVAFYLEIRHERNLASQEAPVTRMIGPFKSFERLSSIEFGTDLGPVAANELTLFAIALALNPGKYSRNNREGSVSPMIGKRQFLGR